MLFTLSSVAQLFLFLFAPLAAHSAELGEVACGSECHGTCFAGKCFDDLDDLDASLANRPLVDLADAGNSRQFDHQVHSDIGQPVSIRAEQASQQASTVAAGAPPPLPNTRAQRGHFMDKDLLTEEVKLLQARLALTKQRQELLQHENAQLHGEVQGWVRLGHAVRHREADLLNSMSDSTISRPSSQQAPIGLLSRRSSYQTSSEGSSLGMTSLFSRAQPSMMVFFLVGTLLCELGVLLLWWHISGNRRMPLKPVLRAMGLAGKVVEFSELQIGGLHAPGGEVMIQLCCGVPTKRAQSSCVGDQSRAVCTRTVEQLRPGALLRFNEALSMVMRRNEGDCVFGIFRRDEPRETRIAHFRIGSSEVLDLVNRAHGEYYRFELVPEASRVAARHVDPDRDGSAGQDTRPYIAMRIRDVSALHKGLKGVEV